MTDASQAGLGRGSRGTLCGGCSSCLHLALSATDRVPLSCCQLLLCYLPRLITVMSLHVCLARALPQCATCFKLRDGPLSSNTGAEILRYGSAWRDDGDGTASTVCLHRLPLLKLFSKLSIDSPLTHLMPPDQVTEHSYDMQDDAADQGLSDSGTKPVTPSAQVVAKNALEHQAQVFFFQHL